MLRQLRAISARLAGPFSGRVDRGATAVEYALLVVLVAAVVVAAVTILGLKTSALFHTLDGAF